MALNGGVARISTAALRPGVHNVVAVYNGDANFTASTSAALAQTVNKVTTKANVVASTTIARRPVKFTATVAALTSGAGRPKGRVTFIIDGVAKGSVLLNSLGQAAFTLRGGLSAGRHTVKVVYSGSGDFLASSASKVLIFRKKTGRAT